MPDVIPNLWPDNFKVDVQTPLTILRVQASYLSSITRGILRGDVETETAKELVQHRLVVIAPAVGMYRHTLLVVRHNPGLVYPAEVRADALAEHVPDHSAPLVPLQLQSTYVTKYPQAYDDGNLTMLVQTALRSKQTLAVILSLIAKSNEATPSLDPPGDATDEMPG